MFAQFPRTPKAHRLWRGGRPQANARYNLDAIWFLRTHQCQLPGTWGSRAPTDSPLCSTPCLRCSSGSAARLSLRRRPRPWLQVSGGGQRNSLFSEPLLLTPFLGKCLNQTMSLAVELVQPVELVRLGWQVKLISGLFLWRQMS